MLCAQHLRAGRSGGQYTSRACLIQLLYAQYASGEQVEVAGLVPAGLQAVCTAHKLWVIWDSSGVSSCGCVQLNA